MQKKFQRSDLSWSFVWLVTKIFYSTVPIPLLFLYVKVKGIVLSFFSPKRFKIKENLKAFFGEAKSAGEIQIITRRHFEYLQRLDLSLIWPKLQGFAYRERCAIEGLPNLEAALAQGKGVILLTAHFGYSRLIKFLLRMRHYNVWLAGPQISEEQKEQWTKFANLVYYKLLKMPQFSSSENNDLQVSLNVRPLVHVLQRNEILVLTADGLRSSNLVPVKLGEQWVPFATGAVSVARGTGAKILPAFVIDSNTDLIGLKLVIEKPLELVNTGNPKEDTQANLEQFARIFESYINRYPHLYRWKRREFFKKRMERVYSDVADRYLGSLSQPGKQKKRKKNKWKTA